MKIYFGPDKVTLIAEWPSEISHMSVSEYLGCWKLILLHIQTFKPAYLLIDATHFEYRHLPEANLIFNEISLILTPENIGIITTNNLLGSKTLEYLLISCPLHGHHVFDSKQDWLLSYSGHTASDLRVKQFK